MTSALTLLLLLSATALPAVEQPQPTPSSSAEFEFAAARLAMGRGDVQEALAAFGRAIQLRPGEPYLRIEYARLLLRTSSAGAGRSTRARWQPAMEQLAAAEQLAADRPDPQREIGLLYLEIADESPEALTAARRVLEAVRKARPDDPEVLMPLGQIYRAQGEVAAAADAFRQAVSLVPGNAWAESVLARTLLDLAQQRARAGDQAGASALLEEALTVSPKDAEVRSALADARSRAGDHRRAAELLAGIRDEDQRADLMQRLVWELYLTDELDEASRRAERLDPEAGGAARTLQVLLLAARSQAERAAEGIASLIARSAENVTLIEAVARALSTTGREAAAEDLLRRLIPRLEAIPGAPGVALARVEQASLLARRARWQEVEAVLRPLAAGSAELSGPASSGWRQLYADALQNLDRPEEALAVLPSAVTDESSRPLVAKRAEIELRRGHEREGTAILERFIASKEPGLVLQAARVFQRTGRYQASIPALELLLSLEPASVDGQYFLAVAYERSGSRQKAVSTFRTLLERSPDFAPALNYLGYMWADRKEHLNEALGYVERAVALDPDNGAYLDSLGWAHFQLGDYENAQKNLERAALLLPEDATVMEHLGDLYRELGRQDLAERHYQRSLDLGADDPGRIREKLEGLDPPGGP